MRETPSPTARRLPAPARPGRDRAGGWPPTTTPASTSTAKRCSGSTAWYSGKCGRSPRLRQKGAPRSVPLEFHQRSHLDAEIAQLPSAAEIRQVDDEAGGGPIGGRVGGEVEDEAGGDHMGADLAEKIGGGDRRSPGGDQVVDQDHRLVLPDRIGVD